MSLTYEPCPQHYADNLTRRIQAQFAGEAVDALGQLVAEIQTELWSSGYRASVRFEVRASNDVRIHLDDVEWVMP